MGQKIVSHVTLGLTLVGLASILIYTFHLPIAESILTVYHGYLFLMLALFTPILFLNIPIKKGRKVRWDDIILAIVSLGAFSYFSVVAYDATAGGWEYFPPRHVAITALVCWALLIEAVRRKFDWIITSIIALFSILPLFGAQLPGFLSGISQSWDKTASFHLLGPDSVLGPPLRALADYLAPFLLFGSAMIIFGGGKFFTNLAWSLMGNTRGGTAKISVVGSALFGMVNGSAIANIATIGSVTIPAMKKAGFPNHFAAAVETCSSCGGPITPPVMGATAFIMAEFMGLPYTTIAIAAAVPALLYYVGLYFQIDGYSAKHGLRGAGDATVPSLWRTLLSGWVYIVAFLILLYYLFVQRLVIQSALYSTASICALSFIARKGARPSLRAFPRMVLDFGKMMSDLTPLLAAVGMIIGSLSLIGIAASFAGSLADFAQGNIALLVLLGALVGYVLGMGVTMTAVYVLMAALIAPAMIKVGINPLAAHMFALYMGSISAITPPVAMASYVAAGLAEAPFFKTGFTAVRLGITIFIAPIVFVVNPALLLQGNDVMRIIITCTSALFGIALLAEAIEGYLIGIGNLSIVSRVLLGAAAVCLVSPIQVLQVAGAVACVVLVVVFIAIKKLRKTATQAA